jgi:hypothetical protein
MMRSTKASDHKRLVRMREIEHAQARKKERATVGRKVPRAEHAVAIARTPHGCVMLPSPPRPRPARPAEVRAPPMPSKRSMIIALMRARNQAGRQNDLVTLNRLCTFEGATAFLRQRRLRAYGRIQSKVNGIHSAREARLRRNEVAAEIATQTEAEEAEAAAAAELMASDEQALDDLAQADLAYLQMVRHKLGHPGALTSSAEHLLAESWQQCARAALT